MTLVGSAVGQVVRPSRDTSPRHQDGQVDMDHAPHPFLTCSVNQRRAFVERTCQMSSNVCMTSKEAETVTAGLEPAA